MNYEIGSYKKVEIETNDPIKLVIMLFEGAINFTEKAKKRMMDNKIAEKGILISKVMAIVDELHSSLNMKSGGEVAANMNRIYIYITERLSDANINNDPSILVEVTQHFRVLKEAWVKVYNAEVREKKAAQQQSMSSYQQPALSQLGNLAPKPQYNPMTRVQPQAPQGQKELKPIEIVG